MAFEDIAVLLGTGISLVRATVLACLETGEILVGVPSEPPERMLCDFLVTSSATPPDLRPGDTVLVLWPAEDEEKGCVLGRVGAYRAPQPADPEIPDRIVVEAREELTLKCGAGTVSLRGDGKVLIQGQDLVAHARRTHRIKGGSVAIN
jgi:hypothetical protein